MKIISPILNIQEFKTKVMKISFEAQKDLKELRREMKKANPSPEKISNLLCGTKYNEPI